MGLSYNISKLIPVGAQLVCADSSGAKKLQVIGYLNYQGTRKRRLSGGVGSVAVVTVKKGPISLLSKTHFALIIRQKYPYIRKKGPELGKIRFEDNAAILLDSNKNPIKTTIKGVVAREVSFIKKYSALGAVFK